MTAQPDKGTQAGPPPNGWDALSAWLVDALARIDAMDGQKGGTE